VRGTGVGWALGVGRIGSIVGPVVGGVMLAQHWDMSQVFLSGAIPALCAMAAVAVMWMIKPRTKPHQAENHEPQLKRS
jgi:AAHS family 4-hydroxybenzoate transporter-like MFS transporter